MELDDKTKRQKRNTIIWIVALAIVVLGLAALLIWQIHRLNKAKEEANATPTVTATVSATATKTATKTATSTSTTTATSEDQTPNVRQSAEGYLGAYVGRDLPDAKPYMTDSFFGTWTAEAFAGVSSPGRLNYQIVDISTVADRWEVSAKVNLQLGGEDAGYESWKLDVVLEGGKYLVNAMTAISL